MKRLWSTALLLCSILAHAETCDKQGVVEHHFDQAISGFHTFALREMLNLSTACSGHRIEKVFVWASARAGGLGVVRLMVNHVPASHLREISNTEPQNYEFVLSSGNNALDTDIHSLEIQIEGDLQVSSIGAVIGAESGEHTESHSGDASGETLVYLGSSRHAQAGLSNTIFDVSPRDGKFHALVLKAVGGDYHIERLNMRFEDGQEQSFIGFSLKEGETHRIDFQGIDPGHGVYLRYVSVLGASSGNGQLEISGVGEGRNDRP